MKNRLNDFECFPSKWSKRLRKIIKIGRNERKELILLMAFLPRKLIWIYFLLCGFRLDLCCDAVSFSCTQTLRFVTYIILADWFFFLDLLTSKNVNIKLQMGKIIHFSFELCAELHFGRGYNVIGWIYFLV